MWKESVWLKLPQEELITKNIIHGDLTGRFAYFRCELDLPQNASLTADITANSRYRLWVNGKPVLSGPCKGDLFRQYYETIDLTEYLVCGKNAFCVQVLYCDPDTAETQIGERASIYGVIGQRCGHRFAMEGDVFDKDGRIIASVTTGKADWRVWLDDSFFLKSTDVTCYLGAVVEEIDFSNSPVDWKKIDFNASLWRKAEQASTVLPTDILYYAGVMPKFRMQKREIPLMLEKEDGFVKAFSRHDGRETGFVSSGAMTVKACETVELILDAGAIKNGYPCYRFKGGKGASVSVTYFEKFGGAGSDLKRTDYINGEVLGLTDTVILCGKEVSYEPFWVRTFRFVRIEISAAGEDVYMQLPTFRRTCYPLEVKSSVRSSQPWVGRLWEICVRTLKNCMLETYMDCPYYEQLQFAMDTRLEALYTYAVSNDSRLARKALIDFHYGMQPEGLTAGKYPSVYLQILSTFSLHYIIMLWEYYEQTGDAETVRFCRGDVDRILDYYGNRIEDHGLVGKLDFWQFVDWQPDWAECAGIPKALLHGPSTIINLMYAYALGCAQKLFCATGRNALAEEYAYRRQKILSRVQELCWDEEKGMYREGPEFMQFSQMAQAWAVVNEMHSETQARDILTTAANDPNCLKCSFSTAFEWFRALEKAGMYERMRKSLNDWIMLLEKECTTCPETPLEARSECHAWSALPMYELMRTFGGIRYKNGKIFIQPHLVDLKDLSGSAITPVGEVNFEYIVQPDGRLSCRIELPDSSQGVFVLQNGEEMELFEGENCFVI